MAKGGSSYNHVFSPQQVTCAKRPRLWNLADVSHMDTDHEKEVEIHVKRLCGGSALGEQQRQSLESRYAT